MCGFIFADVAGVYPRNAVGRGYVDYSYVGGSQNPLKDPVPEGTLQFFTTLPNGVYNYRYMSVILVVSNPS